MIWGARLHAAGHGDADVGGREGGSVIDAVAHHRHARARRPQLLHLFQLALHATWVRWSSSGLFNETSPCGGR